MKRICSAVINIIVSVFLLIAVHTFLHPCEGAMDMPCTYSTKTAVFLLVLAVLINVGRLFVSDQKARLTLSITTVAIGIEVILVPQMGRCLVASMSCNAKTFPALYVGSLFIIVLTIIFEVADLLGEKRRKSNVHSK